MNVAPVALPDLLARLRSHAERVKRSVTRDELGVAAGRRGGVGTMSLQWRCAAVVYGPGDDVDAALSAAVETLQRAGRRVGGLLQRFGARWGRASGRCCWRSCRAGR